MCVFEQNPVHLMVIQASQCVYLDFEADRFSLFKSLGSVAGSNMKLRSAQEDFFFFSPFL